ncbi:MAG: DUF547 domain-containing protein [Planctomycetota bacterium]|nr:DUF547 domain-containing protein [Planctomycetota bacterium]
MKPLILFSSLLLACLGATFAVASAQDSRPTEAPAVRAAFDHSPLTALLTRHVQDERVDYAGLERDRAQLDAYILRLEAVTPKAMQAWSEDERFAFWANTYNAVTLQLIVDHYRQPGGKTLGSITDISFEAKDGERLNAWQQPLVALGAFHPDGTGKDLTLDAIENRILRPTFGDERVHAAVNCASIGCPPLRAEAFLGKGLDAQLDDQMAAFLSGPRNAFDKAAKTVRLSRVFDWYGSDFVDAEAGTDLADWLVENGPASAGATAEDRAWIATAKLDYLEYDWALNDVVRDER